MITVYSKPHCPECDKMKAMLSKKQIDYNVIDVSNPTEREKLMELLPNARSVPQVFNKDVWIGSRVEEVRNALTML